MFDKWSQALASADELVSWAEGLGDSNILSFIMPILVVSDETLWVADYSEDGQLVDGPKQVEEAVLFVGREYGERRQPSYAVSHLHIITKRQVRPFLSRLVNNSEYWRRIFDTSSHEK